MDLQLITLKNGIRLVHQAVSGNVAHCGVFINAGSRDESDQEHGVAHFIEHTIFKGTTKRSLFQILNRLEHVGAELNAFTTKEETCIYASFLVEYYDRTLELFQDILFNPTFPAQELEKEKQVVIDEIKSYQDSPSEQIFDDFEDFVFDGHPLGKNILGTGRSLKRINREKLLEFIRRNYQPDEIVIVSVGKIDFRRLTKLVEKYFDKNPDRTEKQVRHPFTSYRRFEKVLRKKTMQVHCMLGQPAYSFSDRRRIPLVLLNNMLGGPILNSRLSLALRERNGITYQNESNFTAWSDSGIASIYFGTDAIHFEKALSLVYQELKRLREQSLSALQLHTIQKQLIGQLAIAQESNLAVMLAMGKHYLLENRYDPVDLVVERIRNTTSAELLRIANEIYAEEQMSLLIFRS